MIAAERYLAVCQPFKHNNFTRGRVLVIFMHRSCLPGKISSYSSLSLCGTIHSPIIYDLLWWGKNSRVIIGSNDAKKVWNFQTTMMKTNLLPSATVVAERSCFPRCLSFCPRGAGMAGGACVAGRACLRTRRDGHCIGRYASYWNAFLLVVNQHFFRFYV